VYICPKSGGYQLSSPPFFPPFPPSTSVPPSPFLFPSLLSRLAVARPKLSGCRSSLTVLSQVCLGLPVLRRLCEDPECRPIMYVYFLSHPVYLCLEHHSEGAVNSYTTGTEMKDTYRADVDVQNLSCCRPESVYHPDKLQTCIVCRYDAGKPHGKTCPLILYRRPDKPIVEHPYAGPRPAVKECSEYNVCIPRVFSKSPSVQGRILGVVNVFKPPPKCCEFPIFKFLNSNDQNSYGHCT